MSLGNCVPGPNYHKLRDFIRVAYSNASTYGTLEVRLFATSRMFAYMEFVNAQDATDFVTGSRAICIGDNQLVVSYWDMSEPIPPDHS